MKSEISIEIDRPIAEVFEYTNNNVPEWSDTVVSDEVIEEKEGGGVGTICGRLMSKVAGKTQETQFNNLKRLLEAGKA